MLLIAREVLEAMDLKVAFMDTQWAVMKAQWEITKQGLLEGGDVMVSPTTTIYSQRNSLWAGDKLANGPWTLDQSGCLVTAAASALTDSGYPVTPGQLNAWLRLNGGFDAASNFQAASINKLNALAYMTRLYCPKSPAPMGRLDAEIASGNMVIVEVYVSEKVPQHFLRYLGNGQVMDPYYGDIGPLVPRYKGKDAAEVIRSALIYTRLKGL